MPADWYPKATRVPIGTDGGPMRGGPSRGVLHTTETMSWAGTKFYHVEYRPGFGFRQYRPFGRASRALRHPVGTPETNRQGDYCINISVTGYAKHAHLWDDKIYADLIEFIAWCNNEFDIQPISRYAVGHGGEAYGVNGSARMLWDEWEHHNGWCAHQEVPGNTHWDAGKVDWTRLLIGDDMPQFSDEHAEILTDIAKGIVARGSTGWGFSTQGTDLVRKERGRNNPLRLENLRRDIDELATDPADLSELYARLGNIEQEVTELREFEHDIRNP